MEEFTRTELMVLMAMYINPKPRTNIRKFARRHGDMTYTHMFKIIKKLTEYGYIESFKKRRARIFQITEAGKDFLRGYCNEK